MTDLPSLTIAIATTADRVGNLLLPNPASGVDYVVCVQGDNGHQAGWSSRQDVHTLIEQSIGVSHNRNAGLKAARAEIVLFCDDDITLFPASIDELRMRFAEDPGLSLALGWRAGRMPRSGPRAGHYRLTRYNTGHAVVPGIMIRRMDILRAEILFDPDFGVKARFPLGEEFIFVTDILHAGLKGRGFPTETGAHPHQSTGENWHDPTLMVARRAMLQRVFGRAHPVIRLLYTFRYRKRFATRKDAVRFLLGR